MSGTFTARETYTDNTDAAYGYDKLRQLPTVTVNKLNGATLTTPLVTSYSYDLNGNKLTETLPDGEATTFGYDDLDRLTSVTEQQGSTTLFSETFILNEDGTRHSAHEVRSDPAVGGDVTTDSTWLYDADGRLTNETVTSSVSGESYANVFAYDLSGNRASQAHTGPGEGRAVASSARRLLHGGHSAGRSDASVVVRR